MDLFSDIQLKINYQAKEYFFERFEILSFVLQYKIKEMNKMIYENISSAAYSDVSNKRTVINNRTGWPTFQKE